MGVVFEAEDPYLKRPVALKVMKPSLAAFAEYHKRFIREAQLAAAIDHDHIVTIYQVADDGGVPYLAMKLLQGETLEDRLGRVPGGLEPPEVMRMGREVAEGLDAAHGRGLVHRDIKPANIWLEAGRDRVKILDFGLACGTGDDGRFTQAGAVIGTPAYMSPEQANAADIDARCDLFSLGAVLYRASTGEMPFGGKDTLSVLSALASKTPPAPHTIVSQLPREFSDLVMRLLAKDRNKRPQTAREVVTAIEVIERKVSEAAAAAAEPDVPVAKILKRETPPPAPPAAKEAVPVAKVLKKEAPAATVNGNRLTDSAVKRKGQKKPRQGGRTKSLAGDRWDVSRYVLMGSLALLGLGVMVLVIGIIRYASSASDEASPSNAPRPTYNIRLEKNTPFGYPSLDPNKRGPTATPPTSAAPKGANGQSDIHRKPGQAD
jgi:hypothetical protein